MKSYKTIIATLILAPIILTGCKSIEYLEVPTVKVVRDTIADTRFQRDSIYLHDRIYLQGDTVYRDRWHYRDRILVDSVYITRTDTVSVPRVITRTVERNKSFWERTFETVGKVVLLILAGWLFIGRLRR